jgi:ligand-binding sensor domain-containing protein/signal transduction histidine kinase
VISSLKRHRWALNGITWLFLFSHAYALDPNRSLFQYVREYWNTESKFAGGAVNAIGQTNDGYLWIGTDKGLFRFDGFDFTRVTFSPVVDASKVPVLNVLTDASGNLWIRVQGSDVLHQQNGKFETAVYETGPPSRQVTAVSKDRSGAVLVSDVIAGTFRFGDKEIRKLAVPNMLPGSSPVISMAETSEGKIWLGTLGAGLFRLANGRADAVNAGLPERKINCLLPISDDDLWVGTDNGLYHWNGRDFRLEAMPPSLDKVQVLSLLRDRDSNVWVGTARGLLRINAKGTLFSEEKELRGDGAINALFEDREGNVWVGGARGFGRIRDTVFVTYSSAIDPRFERIGSIHVDAQGRGWFAPGQGGLYTLKDAHIQPAVTGIPANDVVYSIEGNGDEMWVGRQRGGLTHLQLRNGVTSKTYTESDGLAQNSVYAVFKSSDGSVWAGTVSGGVSRFRDSRFTTYTASGGLASNAVFSIVETRDRTMWFATSNGLSTLFNDRWKTYRTPEGLPSTQVNCLFQDSSGTLWSGTARGLAFFANGNFHAPSMPDVLHEPIFAIAEDKNGWLWITTSNHVLQVPRDKLIGNNIGRGEIREYGAADGLPSSEGINRSRSMSIDSGGRIWISLKGGLSVVDPSHLASSWPSAIAHVEAVTADGTAINQADSMRVPASHKRITFSYTALSLAVPERIRFRYFLEGFDPQWSEPSAARDAVYTNLGPGTYRFRLLASNSYGEWNGSEGVISFEVEPALWQTWWFRTALALLTVSLAWVLYRFQLHRETQELKVRFEERLAERTRIAQDLHDTLLQGFLSASMQLQVADDRLPDDSPAKPLVTRVIVLMRRVIDEGRNVVRGLRSANDDWHDLAQAFSRVAQELGLKEEIEFRVIVEGIPQALHPVIRDEVYRVGRESLMNAFRHARANKVEVEVDYSTSSLRILIRDNGCGIDPHVLRGGREGHWGLPGMRERAEKIGAKLKVWSRAGAGTEIELTVPSHIAFQSRTAAYPLKWFARLYPRAVAGEAEKPESKREQ